MKVKVAISNRHIHLTEEAYNMLFTKKITKKNEIGQKGEFAANETLTIEWGDKKIENVRIVGPFRKYNQIEISNKDARLLGINPPVRKSGDLKDAVDLIVTSDEGSYNLKSCCIISNRHVHMNQAMADALKVKNDQEVRVKVDGPKGGEIKAFIKITDNGVFEFHIDTDDANSLMLNNGDEVELEI